MIGNIQQLRYRQHDSESVRLIRFIKRAQELGFTHNEIGQLIGLRSRPTSASLHNG
ncbi:MAG TPA: MerR family DNA-binding protein [Blastocatellia bacterium]|nr:MerR family DNA-binding protein [Blastocatellia bacterium]